MEQRLRDGSAFALRCSIPHPESGKACGRPTMRAAGVGLSSLFCRRHCEHRARHGSFWKSTYKSRELRPYLTAAATYVRLRRTSDKFIAAAITNIRVALDEAGPVEIATRLRGMSAAKRAKIGLARLRVAEVAPERIVATVLAVSALIEDDPKSHRIREFRTVQICKALHRLASGTHKVWEVQDWQGRTRRTELHAFPRSSGKVLRIMGRMIEEPCDWVVEKHLSGVLIHKKRYGRHPRQTPNQLF